MEACLDTSHSPRETLQKLIPKNILIRQSCLDKPKVNNKLECPETFYILKYNPKYYKNLALQVTRQHRLLSKIKRIKKLKKFTGVYHEKLPQKLWSNLLANNRKEMEEMPETIYSGKWDNSAGEICYKKRLNLQKIKFFYNIKQIWVRRWRRKDKLIVPFDDLSFVGKYVVKYLWGMRRIKRMRIKVDDGNYEAMKWIIEKLNQNGSSRFLCRLKTLSLQLHVLTKNYHEFIQYKIFFSYVTELMFYPAFGSHYDKILQISKNLKSLNCKFSRGVNENLEEYNSFLISTQLLPELKSIQLEGVAVRNLCRFFKPRPSLRVLSLTLRADYLRKEESFERNMEFVGLWEEITELDMLEFQVLFATAEEIYFLRIMMTMMLKKVLKLRSLKLQIFGSRDGFPEHELLKVEEISHLSESLEKFEYEFLIERFRSVKNLPKFDMRKMKLFRKLKELKFEHIDLSSEDLKEAVLLLNENQKENAVLEVKRPLRKRYWLREAMQEIEKIKRRDLRIIISLELDDYLPIEILKMLCTDIQESVKEMKGLEVRLRLQNLNGREVSPEQISETLNEFKEISNLRIFLQDDQLSESECIRFGGKRECFEYQCCEYQ